MITFASFSNLCRLWGNSADYQPARIRLCGVEIQQIVGNEFLPYLRRADIAFSLLLRFVGGKGFPNRTLMVGGGPVLLHLHLVGQAYQSAWQSFLLPYFVRTNWYPGIPSPNASIFQRSNTQSW